MTAAKQNNPVNISLCNHCMMFEIRIFKPHDTEVLIKNITHIINKANISFLPKSLTCFLLAKVPTTSPLPLYFSGNMFHLTELFTFSVIKAKNSPASLKYSQWIFLVMGNYVKIHFPFNGKLDIYVLVMTASCGKKEGYCTGCDEEKHTPEKIVYFLLPSSWLFSLFSSVLKIQSFFPCHWLNFTHFHAADKSKISHIHKNFHNLTY